jgi:hypothetical protein
LIIAFGGSTSYVEEEQEDERSSFWNPLTELKTFHLALPGVLLVVTGYSMSFGPLTVSDMEMNAFVGIIHSLT